MCNNINGHRELGSIEVRELTPVFLYLDIEKAMKQLDIYIDESGNFDSYSKHNLIYSVAFVMVDSLDKKTNDKQMAIFHSKLSNIVGGDHFVHVGNLVRGEKPYEETLLSERQDLFYILFLLAKYSKFKVVCSIAEKKEINNEIYEGITDSVIATVKGLESYLSSYEKVIVHYDNGQDFLKGALLVAFRIISKNVAMVKTLQQENAFMQVADLFSYFELIKYKIQKAGLSKYEIDFFGESRKIKKDYLKQLEKKRI